MVQYSVMPFYLAYAPSVFQWLINDESSPLHTSMTFYSTLQIFPLTYPSSYCKLRENHSYVKGEKCKFHIATTTFPSWILSPKWVIMDQEKVQAISDRLVPSQTFTADLSKSSASLLLLLFLHLKEPQINWLGDKQQTKPSRISRGLLSQHPYSNFRT